ncbi:hypothetical protein M8542_35500 [Amycolatopsis sp. OK19-0408]|uniref:Secreted protein n=1 Tax=Amycolatopsis iheyensis TaxID=2945988 RepID=A0A9X2NKV4_9PSEU|nr:hypothetical protein [Amycolatopsis iheyensis]MCR6488147.1 hypothetical protein [Amycolatopsis iheyensis]
MKRILVPVVTALAAFGLLAAPAAAQPAPSSTVCIPESVRLTGVDGTSICLAVPTPSIDPPFRAVREGNGSQDDWCLFTGPKYSGLVLRLPAFSAANVFATFASGRPC